MRTRWLMVGATALAVGSACDSGEFDCNEGTCTTGEEICVRESDHGCSTCIPIPAACQSNPSCACMAGVDLSHEPTGCSDNVSCEEADGDLVVTCTLNGWGCG